MPTRRILFDDDQVIKLYKKGLTIREISKIVGFKSGQSSKIIELLRNKGIIRISKFQKGHKGYRTKESYEKMFKKYGFVLAEYSKKGRTKEQIEKWKKTYYSTKKIPYNKKDIGENKVIELYKKGNSMLKISKIMGYKCGTSTRIAKLIKSLNLSKKMGFQKGHIFSKGKNNPAFNNWASRELYGQEFSPELKKSIRHRDNHVCQECKWTEKRLGRKLDVHHIDFNKRNNDPNNLISLCKSCHGKTQFNKEQWIRYYQTKIGDINA